MRRRPVLIEWLLLAFFGVFLLYPLGYIFPGAFSDQDYEVRLLSLGEEPAQKAQAMALLKKAQPNWEGPVGMKLPFTVKTYQAGGKGNADQLVNELRDAGAQAELITHVHPTTFYFDQALGFTAQRSDTFPYFHLEATSPALWECLRNSLALGLITTLVTTLLCLPLAYWFTRFRFPGRGVLATLLLTPLLVPPFVGAIGLERFLGRFGTLNLWLNQLGILGNDTTSRFLQLIGLYEEPGITIDWLGRGGFFGVVVMQVLHLYPILYLNLAAAWANIDTNLEDAARNLGAGEWRIFRTITFPLLLPGYFAGATLVFVWAFTDLGTPLVFNQNRVIPVQIYDQVSNPQLTNSVAYALVVVTLVVTAALFYAARWLVNRQAFIGVGKGATAAVIPQAGHWRTLLIWGVVLGLTLAALLPDIGVVLTALARRWSFTALPESYTTAYLQEVWSDKIAALSIRNSVLYSAASTMLDLALGIALAWLVVRRPTWLTGLLDGLAMLPLALPGLVLAFGYLTCYSKWNLGWLDPTRNPALLLIVAYTVRRLPYLTRSAQAGLQQVAPVLEEAAENLGAGRLRVLRTVTLPLIAANVVAGVILTFAFALLEVSDSLMLAREERFFPITKAILGLLMRPDDGDSIACALALFAMVLLGMCLLAASLALGRKLGELFRA
jgi:iron(III) transport system permease protein